MKTDHLTPTQHALSLPLSLSLSLSLQSCRGREASRPSVTARAPPAAASHATSRATAPPYPPTRASRSASSPPTSPRLPGRTATAPPPPHICPHSISQPNHVSGLCFSGVCSVSGPHISGIPAAYSISIVFLLGSCQCFCSLYRLPIISKWRLNETVKMLKLHSYLGKNTENSC